MKIHGLQKMTLLDYPGKIACTVFLGGCDFRCPFCHNWEIIDGSEPAIMNDVELIRWLEGRKNLLEGVAVTGGEPMLRRDLPEFLREIRELGYPVKCDTNGNHPDMLEKCLRENLVDYVAMDIKNSKERYGETIGLPGFDTSNVERSVKLLLESEIAYEFRTTVTEGMFEASDFEKIGRWIEGAQHYYLQAFTDRDTVPVKGLKAPKPSEMRAFSEIVRPFVKHAGLRGID